MNEVDCSSVDIFFPAVLLYRRQADPAHFLWTGAERSGASRSYHYDVRTRNAMASPTDLTSCNLTTYHEWYEAPYEDTAQAAIIETELMTYYSIRRDEVKTWEIMAFDETQLQYRRGRGSVSNGQAMELSTEWCRSGLASLLTELAGGHGPVRDQSIHDAMCHYCFISDALRVKAMNVSACDCLQLSTGPKDLAFVREGDYCQMNSGRLLCNAFPDRCSQEDCLLKDFHCPRREYDAIHVALKGLGGECSDGSILIVPTLLSVALLIGLVVVQLY